MDAYKAMKGRHQKEVNGFPMFFAFNNKQFEEGMAKFGLKADDTEKIYKLGNTGGFYLRTDAPRLFEMFDRQEREQQEAIANDITGDGYIYQMFLHELNDHEYGYTRDPEGTLHDPETWSKSLCKCCVFHKNC